MSILFINASPNKNGNTAKLAKELLAGKEKSFCHRNDINGDMTAEPPIILTGETTACENCGREIQQIVKRKKTILMRQVPKRVMEQPS